MLGRYEKPLETAT